MHTHVLESKQVTTPPMFTRLSSPNDYMASLVKSASVSLTLGSTPEPLKVGITPDPCCDDLAPPPPPEPGKSAETNHNPEVPNHNFLTRTVLEVDIPTEPVFVPSLRIAVVDGGTFSDTEVGTAIIPLNTRIPTLPGGAPNPAYRPPNTLFLKGGNQFLSKRMVLGSDKDSSTLTQPGMPPLVSPRTPSSTCEI